MGDPRFFLLPPCRLLPCPGTRAVRREGMWCTRHTLISLSCVAGPQTDVPMATRLCQIKLLKQFFPPAKGRSSLTSPTITKDGRSLSRGVRFAHDLKALVNTQQLIHFPFCFCCFFLLLVCKQNFFPIVAAAELSFPVVIIVCSPTPVHTSPSHKRGQQQQLTREESSQLLLHTRALERKAEHTWAKRLHSPHLPSLYFPFFIHPLLPSSPSLRSLLRPRQSLSGVANRGAVVANRDGDGGGASGVGCVALSPLGAVMLLVARPSR